MSSATKAGLIGEHLSAAAILQIDEDRWSAGLVQQDKVDVIAWDDVGFIRVQVKALSNDRPGQRICNRH